MIRSIAVTAITACLVFVVPDANSDDQSAAQPLFEGACVRSLMTEVVGCHALCREERHANLENCDTESCRKHFGYESGGIPKKYSGKTRREIRKIMNAHTFECEERCGNRFRRRLALCQQ